MVKIRFKEPAYNAQYQLLIGKTPQQVSDMGIYGSILDSFTKGYNGHPQPKYMGRNSFAYIAYVAGKESKK